MWIKSSSYEKPESVKKISGNRCLLRRNISTVSVTDIEGNAVAKYEYEEKVVNADTYDIICAINEQTIRREAEILDEYTEQLMAEGVI